ncbi:MAG: hypothetical protein QOI06_2309 [Nocardioidaceae bacterium]|jgi:hypothetical protein|nr:hypothetical protein [Nocardioidaceae bacterium]
MGPPPGSAAGRRRRAPHRGLVIVLAATLLCGGAATIRERAATIAVPAATISAAPPRPAGYFDLKPVGSWARLPGDRQCDLEIHRSTWEPRPVNNKRNNVMPDPAAVHQALLERPRDTAGGYDPRWDTWLLPRVDGQFRGTTDEILQWAACKWGLPDNLLRAIAVRESTWYQYPTYHSGRCVTHLGCGDSFSQADHATTTFCRDLAQYGYDYQRNFGPGLCPKTYSVVGIMAWQAPKWGRMLGNQNGTFPFSRDSTAYAADYLGATLRGCFEGWEVWLANTGKQDYRPGQLWGCVGSWYSGGWNDPAAKDYVRNVKAEWQNHTWLKVAWPIVGPGCSAQFGCIGTDPLRTTSP